jgi:anti-anti-sigma factor
MASGGQEPDLRSGVTFEIHDSSSAGYVQLSLTGELDLASASILEDRLTRLRAKRSPVQLDLSQLEFIDSSGIRLLVQTIGEARAKRWPVEIDPEVGPRVRHVFRLARLDHIAGWSSSDTRRRSETE